MKKIIITLLLSLSTSVYALCGCDGFCSSLDEYNKGKQDDNDICDPTGKSYKPKSIAILKASCSNATKSDVIGGKAYSAGEISYGTGWQKVQKAGWFENHDGILMKFGHQNSTRNHKVYFYKMKTCTLKKHRYNTLVTILGGKVKMGARWCAPEACNEGFTCSYEGENVCLGGKNKTMGCTADFPTDRFAAIPAGNYCDTGLSCVKNKCVNSARPGASRPNPRDEKD